MRIGAGAGNGCPTSAASPEALRRLPRRNELDEVESGRDDRFVPSNPVVRWKVDPLERDRRGLDERFALAAPWFSRRISTLAARQPAGSRLRRLVLTQAVRVAVAANNRGDYEAMLINYHPGIELIPPSKGESALGFDPVYRGHEGVRRFFEQWKSGFGRHTYEPREIADSGGARFALRLRLAGTIGDTDAEVAEEYGNVNTLEGGFLVRQENFYDWADALAALSATSRNPSPRLDSHPLPGA